MESSRRREARERALSILYEAESRADSGVDVLDAQVLPPDEFSESIVRGVGARQAELDEIISRLSEGWPLERMPMIDRIVLRMALFELMNTDTPSAVILSEAVELAKRYSTDSSGRFVNGLLASAEREVRPTRNG